MFFQNKDREPGETDSMYKKRLDEYNKKIDKGFSAKSSIVDSHKSINVKFWNVTY